MSERPAPQLTPLAAGGTALGFAGSVIRMLTPFASLAAAALLFRILAPDHPFRLIDAQIVSTHTVIVGIAALGMTLLIAAGGIDLSVGSAIALTTVCVALVLKREWPLPVAVMIALTAGILCGLYNGLLVVGLRLPPFIATLGTLGFFRGVAKWLSGSVPVTAPTAGLEHWVSPVPREEWMIVSPGVWLTLVLGLLTAAVLHWTIFGRYALAIGSNEATARLCGIRVGRMKVWIYAVAGVFVGLAGLLQFGRITQGDPTVAIGLELDIIAAVVIGGATLTGGHASVAGALAGAALMAFLRNRCTILGWPNFVQEMIVGHIIILAVAIDQWRARARR